MTEFVSPPWTSPLDLALELDRIPESATQKGMFMIPMVAAARKMGRPLASARERYLPFHDYPLREHARLLAEAAALFFPDDPLRIGLRRLGRGAHAAFVDSTVGKVVWASATEPQAAVDAILRAYEISFAGCNPRVLERGKGLARVSLSRIYYFLDSHHVGCFESALRSVNVEPEIKIKLDTWSACELLITW